MTFSSPQTSNTILPVTTIPIASGSPLKQKRKARRVLQAARRPLRRLIVSRRSRQDEDPEYGSFGNDHDRDEQTSHSTRMIPSGDAESLPTERDDGSVAMSLERLLRPTILILIAFCCGVWFPQAYNFFLHAAEYIATAWATCVLLIVMTCIRSKRANQQKERVLPGEMIPLISNAGSSTANSNSEVAEEHSDQSRAVHETIVQPHPSLDKFYVINAANNERLLPNTEPFPLDNELFSGHMIVMVRTPDVDDNNADPGSQSNSRFSEYFRPKQRRWEMQWQVKLKKKPEGKVYFACELEESVKMGVLQRTFVSAAMAFVKKMNPAFHYSITGQKPEANGCYEKPHMAFTIENGMDRIVVTKKGQTPPILGGKIEEDSEHMRKRKQTGMIEWSTDYVYTFAVWTAYFDFLEWKTMHFPGIRPFTLSSVVGPQPIVLSLYTIAGSTESDKHYQRDMTTCSRIEISNSEKMTIGPHARQWTTEHKKQNRRASLFTETESVEASLHALDDDNDADEGIYTEEQTISELGDGLYLRSGDLIHLKGWSQDTANGYLSNGGGFAIIQNNSPSTIVIEKAKSNRRRSSAVTASCLLRTGDAVSVKLILQGSNGQDQVKYLSIHRGWWLKWVNQKPMKNGFFTIHTNETDIDINEHSFSRRPQNSYVALGGTFWLRHKRWTKFGIGIGNQESTRYGGRLLGLLESSLKPSAEGEIEEKSDGEDDTASRPDFDEHDMQAQTWMDPIVFTAHQLQSIPSLYNSAIPAKDIASTCGIEREDETDVHLTTRNCIIDVPVWIEMMHRTNRCRQLAYAVRITMFLDDQPEKPGDSGIPSKSFLRLRRGRTLAGIVRAGLRYEDLSAQDAGAYNTNGSSSLPRTQSIDSNTQRDELSANYESGEESNEALDVELQLPQPEPSPTKRQRNGRKMMGKIGNSVKIGTSITGKRVAKQGKKVGETTMKAGKAIIAPISATTVRLKRPPSDLEPRNGKVKPIKRSMRRKDRDLMSVNRSMKRRRVGRNTSFTIAGQLSPAEQSLRTTSHALWKMSNADPMSELAAEFESTANQQLVVPTELDSFFLTGGASQLGVDTPMKESLIHGSLLARCIWESHWREEWCGIYESSVTFFGPLGVEASLQLSYLDITSIRSLDVTLLADYPVLAIETGWQCSYLSFLDTEVRDAFAEKIYDQMRKVAVQNADTVDSFLVKARFWQGLQDSVKAEMVSGNHKWAKIPSGTKMKHRTVLNCRRLGFDVDPFSADEDDETLMDVIDAYVRELLQLALSITHQSLETSPGQFVKFLDMTSRLRSIPLGEIDYSDPTSICIFVNLYHCLYQHALLLTINGPVHKRSIGHFHRTSCYEIGGDIFSLSEIYHRVVRGSMGKPFAPKHPYVDIPRKSNSYQFYSLRISDPRIAFVLNTGDLSCPQSVFILSLNSLNAILNQATTDFVRKHVIVDSNKGLIVLPKVCDVYRYDFGPGDINSCLQFCTQYVDTTTQHEIERLERAAANNGLVIRFAPCSEQFHLSLTLPPSKE